MFDNSGTVWSHASQTFAVI